MTSDQLIADMKATFPGIFARPIREFSENYRNTEGVWTGGDEILMPDGQRMFGDFFHEEGYEFGIHTGFLKWLEMRGWYIESYDPLTHMVVRLPTAEELVQWAAERAAIEQALQGPRLPAPLDCPF